MRRHHHGKLAGLAVLQRPGRVVQYCLASCVFAALSCPPFCGGALFPSRSHSQGDEATRRWQMEGTAAEIAVQRQRIFGIASKFRGLDAGEENVSYGTGP